MIRALCLLFSIVLCSATSGIAAEVISLWPDAPPEFPVSDKQEEDINKPTDNLIAGRRIIKLANVNHPEIHLSLPEGATEKTPVVLICPGGGFNILAWDLEGTEVAEWLNKNGIAAAVLKYRVPTRQFEPMWKAPVQDAQRAIRILRTNSEKWNLDPQKVGILGFSAGGHTAARASLTKEAQYAAIDKTDEAPFLPNASILIYPAYLDQKDGSGLTADLKVDSSAPPTFLVHAFDDPISVRGSLYMALALKDAGVPFDLHVYETGGHGYGLRPVENKPVTLWPNRCEEWLTRLGWKSK